MFYFNNYTTMSFLLNNLFHYKSGICVEHPFRKPLKQVKDSEKLKP